MSNSQCPPYDRVLHYHQLSKHRFDAYAPGPETLDWDSQPNPFRHFAGAEVYPLDPFADFQSHTLAQILQPSEKPLTAQPLSPESLSAFLRSSLGLSAWKQYGPDQWSLRVNPSSGNLHPTETYVLLGAALPDSRLPPGVFHYRVDQHQLERRGSLTEPVDLPGGGFLLAFTSVYWRESWKYGERAFRYCQLDVGHAIAAVTLAAKSVGWQCAWLSTLDEQTLTHALGLAHESVATVRAEEREHIDCCLYISTAPEICSKGDNHESLYKSATAALQQTQQWHGVPNGLAEKTFYRWPEIKKVMAATAPQSSEQGNDAQAKATFQPLEPCLLPSNKNLSALQTPFYTLAKGRRSAQRFTREPLAESIFYSLINSLFWFQQPLLMGASEKSSVLHFVIAVHDVTGLEPGLYLAPGCVDDLDHLSVALGIQPDSTQRVGHSNDLLCESLIRIKTGDFRRAVGTLCCQQAIAADCNFTIGFLARFEQPLKRVGASLYKRLFWQAGSVSQQVYMAATGYHLAATGIGCFFDDPWLEMLGINSAEYQFVYHTAVGTPLVDERIASFSGYHFLK